MEFYSQKNRWINHNIDKIKDEVTMKDTLKKIDQSLSDILELCDKNKIPIIVSSLFGVKKEISATDGSTAVVDFAGKVPVVVVSQVYTKFEYKLLPGDTYSLFGACLKIINPELKVNSMLRKKGFLDKMQK